MSFLFSRNQQVPVHDRPSPMLESRESALRLAAGATMSSAWPHRASRRGDLPDVDFSRIVRLPRASFAGRLIEALGFLPPCLVLAPEEWRVDPGPLRQRAAPAGKAKVLTMKPDRAA